LNRVRISILLAALLALATTIGACGDSGGSSSGGGDPQEIVDSATFKGIESGDLDISLGIDASGEESGHIDVSLAGPFQGSSDAKDAELELTAEANGSMGGEDLDFEGGLTLVPGNAFVNYQGTEYEVDPITYSFAETALKEVEKESGGESAGATACQEAVKDLEVGNFIDNLTNDGSADVGGTSTTKVSGDFDVAGAFDALEELSEGACKSVLGSAGPLPSAGELEEAQGEVEEVLKSAHVELYVGDDDIVRRLSAQLTIEPEEEGEVQSVELDLDISISGVNEDQQISAPTGAKELRRLFLKLGINPIELAGAAQGGDIGSLLQGLTGAFLQGAASGGGSEGPGGGSAESGGSESGQQAYLKCLQGATTPVEIQRCISKLR
jgi:hypothetical protein